MTDNMVGDVKGLSLLLLLTKDSLGDLVTSVVTIIATSSISSTTTPCTELDPITNRMQWAEQCAMAPSNIMPLADVPAATSSYSNTRSSTLSTARSTGSSTSRSVTRTSTSARRSHIPTSSSATANATTTAPTKSPVTGPHQNSSGVNIGVIAGAISSIVVLVMLAWILWRTRNKWLGYFKGSTDRYMDADEKYRWDNRSFEFPVTDQDPQMFWSRSPEELESSPTAPHDVRHLGAGMHGVTDYGYGRSYAVMNPDPPSASTVTGRMQEGSVLSSVQSESEASDNEDNASQLEYDVLSPATVTLSDCDGDAGGDLSPLVPPPPIASPSVYTPYRPGSVWSTASADLEAGNRP